MNDRPKIVITVHGIRTFGAWQARLASILTSICPDITVLSYSYGYFSLLAFPIPFIRDVAARKLSSYLRGIFLENPGSDITIVAHSNGTYLVAKALRQIPKNEKWSVRQLLLCGSVLKNQFDWTSLFSDDRVRRVVNDCGINDNVLLASQFLSIGTGCAGRLGFFGITGTRLTNRFFLGGHSLYFETKGLPDDAFMLRYWVPIILETESRADMLIDERRPLTALSGAKVWFIQNSDPVKLGAVAFLALSAAYFLVLAPNVAKTERDIQLLEQSAIAKIEKNQGIPSAFSDLYISNRLESNFGGINPPQLILNILDSNESTNNTTSALLLRYWAQSLVDVNSFIRSYSGHPLISTWGGKTYLIANQHIYPLDFPGAQRYFVAKDVIALYDGLNWSGILVSPVTKSSKLRGSEFKNGNGDPSDADVSAMYLDAVYTTGYPGTIIAFGKLRELYAGGETPAAITMNFRRGILHGFQIDRITSVEKTCKGITASSLGTDAREIKFPVIFEPNSKPDGSWMQIPKDEQQDTFDIMRKYCESRSLKPQIPLNIGTNTGSLSPALRISEQSLWTKDNQTNTLASDKASEGSDEPAEVWKSAPVLQKSPKICSALNDYYESTGSQKAGAASKQTETSTMREAGDDMLAYYRNLRTGLQKRGFFVDDLADLGTVDFMCSVAENELDIHPIKVRDFGDSETYFLRTSAAQKSIYDTCAATEKGTHWKCDEWEIGGDPSVDKTSPDGTLLVRAGVDIEDALAVLDMRTATRLSFSRIVRGNVNGAWFLDSRTGHEAEPGRNNADRLIVSTSTELASYAIGSNLREEFSIALYSANDENQMGETTEKSSVLGRLKHDNEDIWVVRTGPDEMTAFDPKTKRILWIRSIGLEEDATYKFSTDPRKRVFAIYTNSSIRLFEASTGFPVSRKFVPGDDSELSGSIQDVLIADDLRVVATGNTNNATFVRKAPPSLASLVSDNGGGLRRLLAVDLDTGTTVEPIALGVELTQFDPTKD